MHPPAKSLGLLSGAIALYLQCALTLAQGAPADQRLATQKRSVAVYDIPRISLVRDDGKSVLLADELNDGRAVVLNFIYTTCATTCPVSSQIFAQLQRKLGPERKHVHLMSISIDPDNDTPARLRAYARGYGARPGWHYYTGSVSASVSAQQAFGEYRRDKMDHSPVTFVRVAPGKPWVRLDGFATPDDVLKEIRDRT